MNEVTSAVLERWGCRIEQLIGFAYVLDFECFSFGVNCLLEDFFYKNALLNSKEIFRSAINMHTFTVQYIHNYIKLIYLDYNF